MIIHTRFSRPDLEVERLYCQLDRHLRGARLKDYACIVAGDMNRQVGLQTEEDDANILGPYGLYTRHSRGEMLLQWRCLRGLVTANAHFASLTGEAST